MQALIQSKSAGVTGGRGTAGAGPGRDLLFVYVNSVCYGICLSLMFRFVSYGRTIKGSQIFL